VLKRLPQDCHLAVVLVQHLDPNHESLLVDLLMRVSALPVQWAANNQSLQSGHVCVAPPNSCLSIKNGGLMIREPTTAREAGRVDHFFHSLAEDSKHRAVGVILSGNGSDGMAGAKAIKGSGGIVFAQDLSTASFPSMPRSTIDAGCVDRVLTPAAIAEELVKLTQRAPLLWKGADEAGANLRHRRE
jgi:two-component system CheB/CheR fusion protein